MQFQLVGLLLCIFRYRHREFTQMEILHHSSFLRCGTSTFPIGHWLKHSNLERGRGVKLRVHCNYSKKNEEIGSSEWFSKASPLEVLGVKDDCTEDDIKAAFRAKVIETAEIKVKEFHPDVYKGPSNPSTIVQRVIQAYEVLMMRVSKGEYIQRKNSDPFEEPECEALDIFVNELLCIGKGCLYSCVKRAPQAFSYASETGCARAISQGQGDDYQVQLAVGQCPRNCIYYVTPAQRIILEELLHRALNETYLSTEASLLESLIARANFENNRYQGHPKRNAKHSTEWVDWF